MSSTFPSSGDENVEIHLTSDENDKILLHSYVLALHSTWFKASLSERWSRGGAAPSTDGSKNRWVYELRFDKGSTFGMLARRVEGTEAPLPTTSTTEPIRPAPPANTDEPAEKLHTERMAHVNAHKQMLGALYHITPTFSRESFDTAKTSILLLAEVADAYDCRRVIKIHIENHIRLYRDEMLDLCASDPISKLELAMAIQSEWVFMEASTHLIGRSNRFFARQEARLREMGIADLFQKNAQGFARS